MAFPTQQILFHDQTEATDGDRVGVACRRHSVHVCAYRTRQHEGWPAGKGEVPQPRSISDALSQLKFQGNGSEAGKAKQTPTDRDN